jgi:20S proteasome alpha/beta subunit
MFVNDYTLVAFTGGVSDAQLTNKVLAAELRLKELKTKIRPNVKEAANLLAMLTYRSIRNPSMIPSIVGTLIAGWDENNEPAIFISKIF